MKAIIACKQSHIKKNDHIRGRRIYTGQVKLVGGIELETASCWEKRSGDGGNGIGGVGSGALEGKIVRVVVVMVVMEVKVSRRRRRSGGGGGMAKGKLEEVPDLRFGVRLGISYGHALVLSGSGNGNRSEMNWRKKKGRRRLTLSREMTELKVVNTVVYSVFSLWLCFQNVKSVTDADVRKIMKCGGEKRLTSTRFWSLFFFFFNRLFVWLVRTV